MSPVRAFCRINVSSVVADSATKVAPISPEPWIDRTARAQALVLLRDAIAQANSRALARQDHFDDADDLIEESL